MGPLAAGALPVGAGARPAPGSEITRESRARDRLPRIRMVRAAQDVEEAIRCSDPTECRRTIYNRASSTMILPRPRLMPDGTIWAPVVQPVAAFGHGCAFGRLSGRGQVVDFRGFPPDSTGTATLPLRLSEYPP